MSTDDLRLRAIALYDRYTHEHHDRRAFMADMTRLAGSAAAAASLVAAISASPAAAAIVAADDRRLKTGTTQWQTAPGRTMRGYWARPAAARGRLPGVIVIHENRGLTPHIRDVARRVGLAGFHALAPDFLSPVLGATPVDEDAARNAIGKLDLAAAVADGTATIDWLAKDRQTTGKIGVVGFCWGGAMSNRLAVAAGTRLAAAVPYYGPAPDPAEAVRVKTPLLLHYAGIDERVNKTAQPWIDALKAAGVPATAWFYEGKHHAFNNDTSAERYDADAAKLAWDRTIAFLKQHLA